MAYIFRCKTCKKTLNNNPHGQLKFCGDWYCMEGCLKCVYNQCISTTKIFNNFGDGKPMHPECQLHMMFVKKFGKYDPKNLSLLEIQYLSKYVYGFDRFNSAHSVFQHKLPKYDGDMEAKLREIVNPIEVYQFIVSHQAVSRIRFYHNLHDNIGVARTPCQVCQMPMGPMAQISKRGFRSILHPQCAKCSKCKGKMSADAKLPFIHVQCAKCPCGKYDGILITVEEEYWHVECILKKMRPNPPIDEADAKLRSARENKFLQQFVPDIAANRHFNTAVDFVLSVPDIEMNILRHLTLRDAVWFLTVFRVPINNQRVHNLLVCCAHNRL
jgi:hypothetical protein